MRKNKIYISLKFLREFDLHITKVGTVQLGFKCP